MEKHITSSLRTTFLAHMIVAGVFGLAVFIIPGRSLTWMGWVPVTYRVPGTDLTAPGTVFVDPILMRVLGAALLALAFSSFLGWRAQKWEAVAPAVQFEFAFCALAFVAFVRGAIMQNGGLAAFPAFGWVCVILLAGFGVMWGLALRK